MKRIAKRQKLLFIIALVIALLASGCAVPAIQIGAGSDPAPAVNDKATEPAIQENAPPMPDAPDVPKDPVAQNPGADPPPAAEAEGSKIEKEAPTQPFVILSIDCITILDNWDRFDPAKRDLVPDDGVLFPETSVLLEAGDTVFDVLLRATRASGIHMEFSQNPALSSKYVEGIGNLYEFDCGELSGWTYLVNGQGQGVGSSSYTLADGDTVEWRYTCDQGRDVGVTAVDQ